MSTHQSIQTRVLIVGSGPTGLAAAIELGHRSIPCLIIERNPRVGYAPRAKTTNVRTREHLRRWGIAKDLKAASPLGPYYPSNVLFVTRLAGYELARFENALNCAPGKNPFYSENAQWIPQYTVEEVMRAHAATLPAVKLRFNCEMLSFEQDGAAVRATVRDLETNTEFIVHSDFVIGADGARSSVRDAIGAELKGTYGLSRNYNVVFRAPGLASAHKHGPAIQYWQVNADVPSIIGPMDSDDRWFFMPTAVAKSVTFKPGDAPDLIRRSTGIDLPYEVLSSDEWVASRLLATHYRSARAFLAGDACHLNPPMGGYGMNLGVGDGVDLGWKLSAILQGWGGTGLLESYESERRVVHNYVLDEAESNHATLGNHLSRDHIEEDSDVGAKVRREVGDLIASAKLREFNSLGVVLGYRYEGSPIIVEDGTPRRPYDFINYIPSAQPGHLAPHAWMHDGSSLYDHFGSGFTLLVTDGFHGAELDAAREAARRTAVPLSILQPKQPSLVDLYKARYALIRPDQHVAWRGNEWPENGQQLFLKVSGRISTNTDAVGRNGK